MAPTLLLGLALLGQSKPDSTLVPLALHRSMEIDDLDRDIQRLHDTTILKKAQLATSQRLAQRGLVSRGDIERESADVRYQEACESESIACRALKVYERSVLAQAVPADERKSYALLLDWVRKKIDMAQVDLDYKDYLFKQTRALSNRTAVSRQELEDAEVAFGSAQVSLALGRWREAQVIMEYAARGAEKPYDPVESHRLTSVYLKARIHHFEVAVDAAKRRLEIARERSRTGLIPPADLAIFERALVDAETALGSEQKALERHEATPPREQSKPTIGRDALRLGPRLDNVAS